MSRTDRRAKLKRLAFGAIASIIPFVLVVAIEGVLRVTGVGTHDQEPFIPIPGHADFRQLNPEYTQRYFRGFTPAVAPDVFRAEPYERTLRLFVFGGSSTAGYPYMASSAFPAQLQRKLDRHFFDLEVEVINLGMTAVNSYTLWDLKDFVLDEHPDAVLIYAGHNEYYGAFGAGSTLYALGNRVWLKRLVLRLKRWVLFRLFERLFTPKDTQSRGTQTMMARLAGEQEIAFGDPVFQSGIDQFERNMDAIVETFRGRGIPIFVSTIASNLRDQAPFSDDSVAAAAFVKGTLLTREAHFAEARDAFVTARDYDRIRFRAPAAINDRIRSLAGRSEIYLVDGERRLRSASDDSLEGNDLFVDHLHLNARGYGLIADEFYAALVRHFEYDGLSLSTKGQESAQVDPVDSAVAAINIARLKSGFPFVRQETQGSDAVSLQHLVRSRLHDGSKADSLAMLMLIGEAPPPVALSAALSHFRSIRDTLSSVLLYRALASAQPFETSLLETAATFVSGEARSNAVLRNIALTGWKRTRDLRYLNLLAVLELRQRSYENASSLLDRIETLNPNDKTMLYNQARLHVLLGDTTGASEYFLRYRDEG